MTDLICTRLFVSFLPRDRINDLSGWSRLEDRGIESSCEFLESREKQTNFSQRQQNLFEIKRRNHRESMFNNGLLAPGDRDILSMVFFLLFIILEKGRVSQARRASYCPSTVKSSSIGGPEFTPRTLGTWEIALGTVQTYRDVLSYKKSWREKKNVSIKIIGV